MMVSVVVHDGYCCFLSRGFGPKISACLSFVLILHSVYLEMSELHEAEWRIWIRTFPQWQPTDLEGTQQISGQTLHIC